MVTCKEHYATTRKGKVRVDWNGDQHKLLHVRDLPHSHVCVTPDGEKRITRYGEKKLGSIDTGINKAIVIKRTK